MDSPQVNQGEPSWGSLGQEKRKQREGPRNTQASSQGRVGGWMWGQCSPQHGASKKFKNAAKERKLPLGMGLCEGLLVTPSLALR